GLQTSWPLSQLVVPAAHAPLPPVAQATPLPGSPSSTWPSQSSSIPLHTSGPGGRGSQVWSSPSTQFGVVTWHSPRPQVVVPRPSSTRPLQSLSSPSQASAVGVTSPRQLPQRPWAQVWTPAWQTPMPSVFGSPV